MTMNSQRRSRGRPRPSSEDSTVASFLSDLSSVSSMSQSTAPSIRRTMRSERSRGRSSREQRGSAAVAEAAEAPAGHRHRGIMGAMILGLCIFNVVDFDSRSASSGIRGRRSLLSSLYLSGPSTLLPWAQHHLVDVTDKPDPEAETALFWHIPKSGGTTAKRLYQCMGQTLAHRVGGDPRYGHDKEDELIVFEPHGDKDWKVVNVDTSIVPGILRAKELGLVQSHKTDLIFTMEPQFAGEQLYDEDNKGRFLAVFRHPVDRALSMFYYLQTASWERSYRPEWANMTVMEWSTLPNFEANYVVRKLIGKKFSETVDEMDLIIAKELVRQRFIVGLMTEMNESIRRFNVVLGIDEENERNHKCMEEFGVLEEKKEEVAPEEEANDGERKLEEVSEEVRTHATDKKNSNSHPKFEPGTPEYEAVAGRNNLDMLLFHYVETLFEEQKEIIDSYLQEENVEEHEEDVSEESTDEVTEVIEESVGETQGDEVLQEFHDESIPEPALKNGDTLTLDGEPLGFTKNLANIEDPINKNEIPFFWHVPKCGGTTLQRLYWCMGSTIANEVGVNPKFGQYKDETSPVKAFSPWKDNPGKVVNVDVCTYNGIVDAKKRKFPAKRGPHQVKVDFISTSEFVPASSLLFSPTRQGRMFALFRHPIDRQVSKFYYLQKATWEPTYNTRWAKMSLEEWASRERGENNWMVRNLVGKDNRADLTIQDLEDAKEIIRTKFVVGLMEKFEESVHRFNILLGVDENEPQNQQCISDFSANQGDSHSKKNEDSIETKNVWNSYSHPEADRGSDAWVSLSKIHMYDNLLYRYIVELFAEQRAIFQTAQA